VADGVAELYLRWQRQHLPSDSLIGSLQRLFAGHTLNCSDCLSPLFQRSGASVAANIALLALIKHSKSWCYVQSMRQ
jgi:hypothetical protein